MSARSRPVWRIIRFAFGVAGLTFLIVTIVRTSESVVDVLPAWPQVAGSFGLTLLALVTAARSWGTLFDADRSGAPAGVTRAYYRAQTGKYIPGGIWHPLGQVGLTKEAAGIPTGVAVGAFVIHAQVIVASGGPIGASVAFFDTDLADWVRIVALAGFVPLMMLRRELFALPLRIAQRRFPAWNLAIPPQTAIVRSWFWATISFLSSGSAFALLATSSGATDSFVTAVPAYALAFTAGFLAIPFPSGVGVREAVLAAILGPTALVVGASLVQRLLTMLAEAAMIIARPLGADRGNGS